MKSIPLKTLTLEPLNEGEKGKTLNYRTELIGLLKIRAGGMDFEEMEKSIRLIGNLRQTNGQMLIEDADYDFLMSRFAEARWQVADEAILEFVRDIRGAKTVEVAPVE